MAACNYYLEGNFIGDELQLADFLLSKYKYRAQFGDQIFQLTERAMVSKRKIETEIAKKGEDAHSRLRRYVSKHGIDFDDMGRVVNLEAPAMGTNKFLGKYLHQEGPNKGHRILPEFIKEEYWSRKLERDWPAKNFDDKDKELICEIEGDPHFFDDLANLDVTEESMKKWQKYIQKKWDAQGKIGSSLHAVSELFFGKTGDSYNFEELSSNPNALDTWYNTKFRNKQDEYGKITYGDFVNFEQFRSMVDMCSKLKKQLEDQYGDELSFYPEYTVASDLVQPYKYKNEKTGEDEECKEIIGIIDLLVVDKQGRIHIFDYKTSPKDYHQYADAKQRGFTYQLAVYDRILQHYGIYTGDGSSSIIPIKLNGFKYDPTSDKWGFDGISYEVTKKSESQVDIRDLPIKGDMQIARDLDEFLPHGVTLEVYADNVLEKTQKQIREWCPTYQQQKNMNDEQIRQMIEEAGGFKPNKDNKYVYKFQYGFGEPIIEDTEEALFQKVKKEIESWTYKKQSMVESFKEAFNTAVNDGAAFEFKHARMGEGKQNSKYLSELITPYCDGNYKIVDAPSLYSLGMLMLQNIEDDTVTVLKLTGSKLDFQHEFLKDRTNMNGAFAPDIEEDSKGNSLMLKSINANIEAMEAMLALQNLNSNYSYQIKEIKVINPYQQRGQPVSNQELLYTYKNLMNYKNVIGEDENKFAGPEPKIKMLTDAERLKADFKRILAMDGSKEGFGASPLKFSEEIKPEIEKLNILDWNTDVSKEQLYDKLDELRVKLEQLYPSQTKEVSRQLSDLLKPENQLYNAIMSTMMELKGINVRQQIKDAENWLENMKVWKYGWEGLKLENSGNFKSPILNQLTKSVSNVYQKVKDKVNRENVTVRHLVEDLKKQKNYGWIRSNVTGNQTDMYMNMTYVDSDGDFLFVNPDTLHGAEKAFLEHALDIINKNRYPTQTEATLERWKQANDVRYYRVPLMSASTGSRISTSKMTGTLLDSLKKWNPKNALQDIEEKAMGFFNEEQSSTQDDKARLYEMSNIFDYGESDHREQMLGTKEGANKFEHNVETILLAHCYAYELRNQMSKEMPIIKASALALSMQGAGANTEKGNFNNLVDFVEEYTKGVIKNQSLNDKRIRPLTAITGKARKAASFLALAFSPIQFTYQSLEGIWKACSLIIRKPDGTNAFTAKHMWDAAKSAYKDLGHYSDTPTKGQLMNETYGLNDMDANQFTERINSDHGIWSHFTDFAFRLSSRPDYYNRSMIWGAQMRADGSWDAHEVVNGELKYHMYKDARYAAIKTAPKGSAEYNAAYSRYLAALEQFRNEGVTNPDGTELKVGDDLPRAYTNQEAQGMKAIADGMYGYYNHENKSMLSSYFLGGLATQMKTYWSAKKNQYLAPGGVKLMGKWEDYKEDGQQLYYQTDARGEIDLTKPFVHEGDTNCSGVKVQKWKGQWQEGIILTYSKFFSKWKDGNFKDAWNDLWNNTDVNLRTAYRSNIKHLLIDLFFAVLVGNLFAAALDPWEDDEKKKFNEDIGDLGQASRYAAVKLVSDSVDHSFMDFNFMDSIFSPTMDWQPFSFSSVEKLAANAAKYVTTDASFASTMANSSSALRQAKPILKSIGYNEE